MGYVLKAVLSSAQHPEYGQIIIGVGALISVFAMAQLGFLPPVVITAAYAFLSIRLEDTSILDFLRYAIRYFLLGQQTYAWGLCNPSTDRSDRK